MYKNLEGVHVEFLIQVTVNMPKRQRDKTWIIMAAESVLKEAGTQTLGTYIDKRQATVVEWVALRPILEIFIGRRATREGGGGVP